MGAIQGKRCFSCDGCHRRFSWKLDLGEHMKNCKTASESRRTLPYQQQSELYLLDACFLCGLHLEGSHSEEASFIKGNQKLFNSKQPIMEVLEIITSDSSLSLHTNHTIALCANCLKSVNKWDETSLQLKVIANSIKTVYRSKTSKKRKKKPWLKDMSDLEGDDEPIVDSGSVLMEEERNEGSEDADGYKSSSDIKLQVGNEQVEGNVERNYKCNCGKIVQGLDSLVEHQLLKGCKAKTNKFSCKYCGSVFSEKKLLVVHKKECIRESMVNGAHECDICGRRFLVRGRVETHKRSVHSIGATDQQLCCYCGRIFGSNYNMKSHMAREHGVGQVEMVECQICQKKFSDKTSCQHHMKNIHGDHKYECEHCGKKFATQGMRNHHINEMHNNFYNYKCNICNEEFDASFRFRYHMRKMHSSLQHSCDNCGRTFTMRSDLYRHVRGVHMGIRDPKRFPCKVCGRLFPSLYKVKRHASSHGILENKYPKNSAEVDPKCSKSAQQSDPITPLMVSDETFVSTSFAKGMTSDTLIPRKITTLTTAIAEASTSTPSDSSIVRSVTDSQITSTENTSIDLHHLPSSDIYTAPHITTLTPEILQGNMNAEVVTADSLDVGSVSSIVVSASTVQECLNADDLHSGAEHHFQGHHSHTISNLRRGGALLQSATLQPSLVPVHQMIVFEDSVSEVGHSAFPVRSASQVIAVAQCTNQVISDTPLPSQVICIPHSHSETSVANLPQASFFCTTNTGTPTFTDAQLDTPNHTM